MTTDLSGHAEPPTPNGQSHLHLDLVAGVRPQYIKARYLLELLVVLESEWPVKFSTRILDTGQHISPSLRSPLDEPGTRCALERLEHTERSENSILGRSLAWLLDHFSISPQEGYAVVVFGDANPASVGAYAAARARRPLVHIEAGERRSPLEPEEKNRRIADALADIHLCVTHSAAQQLIEAGHSSVFWTGDLAYASFTRRASKIEALPGPDNRPFILATLHRPENLDTEILGAIFRALGSSGVAVRAVCHPRLINFFASAQIDLPDTVVLSPAVTHNELIGLIKGSLFVISDSGGVLREAHHLRKRAVVRRDGGGWDDLVKAGANIRVGRSEREITAAVETLASSAGKPWQYSAMLHRDDCVDVLREALSGLVSV